MAAYIRKKFLEIELLSDHYSHLRVFGIIKIFRRVVLSRLERPTAE